MSRRIAAIDFGTNTARLLIADALQDGSFQHVLLEREIVRMGGGFTPSRGLSEEAIQRGLNCLGKFSALIEAHQVEEVRGVATSAVRDAANGPDFLQLVKKETGLTLSVIDGILEGTLTLAGVRAGLDSQPADIIVFDIGGGSTEYTIVQQGVTQLVRSLPLGVVRLTEGQQSEAGMQGKIAKELVELKHYTNLHPINVDSVLIGTAGTATTLAAIKLNLDTYDYRKVNNSVISKADIAAIYDRLLPLQPAERLGVPGLEKGREDLIIAGILITLQTLDLFGLHSMKVSDYGLLEGLVVSGNALSL